jgi:antitoxin VapB
LPATYCFNCKEEVFIRKDNKTGDVILSRKPGTWDDFLELIKKVDIPHDFMSDREDSSPQERDIFND